MSVKAEANRPGKVRWKNDEGRRSKCFAKLLISFE
jgi:hypothetical protein